MPGSTPDTAQTPPPRIVKALLDPAVYPRGAHRVETVETHISRLFLTERHVYKLKKPVKYFFLDVSTPQARYLDCKKEVRSNHRLAAGL
jgi:hypothetical protein